MGTNVLLMPLVLTLREVMNVAAILDSLEVEHYAVSDYIRAIGSNFKVVRPKSAGYHCGRGDFCSQTLCTRTFLPLQCSELALGGFSVK